MEDQKRRKRKKETHHPGDKWGRQRPILLKPGSETKASAAEKRGNKGGEKDGENVKQQRKGQR